MSLAEDIAALTGTTFYRWNNEAAPGTPIVVTYTFPTAPAAYDTRPGFAALSNAHKVHAREALDTWAAASGISFVEVPESAGGQIRFSFVDMTGLVNASGNPLSGYAYFPRISSFTNNGVTTNSTRSLDQGGDIYLNADFYAGDASTIAPGVRGYSILLHEIGHALGLKHPFSGNPTIDPDHDNGTYTVMSYDRPHDTIALGSVDIATTRLLYDTADTAFNWNPATLTLSIDGTGGNDARIGTELDDVIRGLGGNDNLFGKDGDDNIDGGVGNDTIDGGTGIDIINGDRGNDIINGGDGDDVLYGDRDADTINGDAGDDYINGGAGNDSLNGGSGIDIVDYSEAVGPIDYTVGTASFSAPGLGSDTLSSIEGVIATNFADRLVGNNSDNVLEGGAGNDLFVGSFGNDRMDGGAGLDTVDYSDWFSAITANLALGTASGLGTDTLISIENLYGSGLADDIRGTVGVNMLDGNGGADTIRGDRGDDIINGGDGADKLYGDRDNDTINGGADNDRVYAGNLDDIVNGDAGADTLIGDAGADTIHGGTENDRVYGGSGNDLLFGDEGVDLLAGSGGDDELNGGTGNDRLLGGPGDNTFIFDANAGADRIFNFQDNSDTIQIDSGYGFVTPADVIAATVPGGSVGQNAIIDLGGGNTISIINWMLGGAHTIAQLENDILIV